MVSMLKVNSGGKLLAHVRCHAHRPASLRIDGAPERARLRKELIIVLPADFGKSLESESARFAYPCAKHDFFVERGRCLVVDLVAQHDPADGGLCIATGDRSPMRGGNVLDPAQINGVVNVT